MVLWIVVTIAMFFFFFYIHLIVAEGITVVHVLFMAVVAGFGIPGSWPQIEFTEEEEKERKKIFRNIKIAVLIFCMISAVSFLYGCVGMV